MHHQSVGRGVHVSSSNSTASSFRRLLLLLRLLRQALYHVLESLDKERLGTLGIETPLLQLRPQLRYRELVVQLRCGHRRGGILLGGLLFPRRGLHQCTWNPPGAPAWPGDFDLSKASNPRGRTQTGGLKSGDAVVKIEKLEESVPESDTARKQTSGSRRARTKARQGKAKQSKGGAKLQPTKSNTGEQPPLCI